MKEAINGKLFLPSDPADLHPIWISTKTESGGQNNKSYKSHKHPTIRS